MPCAFLGEADLRPDIRPAELAAIAACLRSNKGKGMLPDYFAEAMRAVEDAAQFLTESKAKPSDMVIATTEPHGHLKLETAVPSKGITRRSFPAIALTFSNLLAPTGEVDKLGKSTTWFGAITTEKYLREFVRKARRNQILTQPEVDEILESKAMRPRVLSSGAGKGLRQLKISTSD